MEIEKIQLEPQEPEEKTQEMAPDIQKKTENIEPVVKKDVAGQLVQKIKRRQSPSRSPNLNRRNHQNTRRNMKYQRKRRHRNLGDEPDPYSSRRSWTDGR